MEIKKINLDGTEYDLGGGSKLYRHRYFIVFSNTAFEDETPAYYNSDFEILSTSNIVETKEQFLERIKNELTKKPFTTSNMFFEPKVKNGLTESLEISNMYYGNYNIEIKYYTYIGSAENEQFTQIRFFAETQNDINVIDNIISQFEVIVEEV